MSDDPTVGDAVADPTPNSDDETFSVSPSEFGETPFDGGGSADASEGFGDGAPLGYESDSLVDALIAERDEYLDTARRVQAEFENFRKRTEAQRVEIVERANEDLVRDLLPVLDAFDAAQQHGTDVALVFAPLMAALEKRGLAVVADSDVDFDPEIHEAVISEPGDGSDPVVVEVLRSGYLWNGRVLRAAMVKVRQ